MHNKILSRFWYLKKLNNGCKKVWRNCFQNGISLRLVFTDTEFEKIVAPSIQASQLPPGV